MIEHQINEHAGDANVKPDRHCPLRDAAVFIPPPSKNRDEREDDEREHDKSEEDVGDQEREIKPGDEAVVAGRFLTDVNVIIDIAREEKRRRNNRGDHAGDVCAPSPAPDEPPA